MMLSFCSSVCLRLSPGFFLMQLGARFFLTQFGVGRAGAFRIASDTLVLSGVFAAEPNLKLLTSTFVEISKGSLIFWMLPSPGPRQFWS